VASWDRQGWVDNMIEWERTANTLNDSVYRNPIDAASARLVADLYRARARGQRLYPREAAASWNQTLTALRHALRLSPASGRLWAALATAKYEARQLDGELDLAVSRALYFAPRDAVVRFEIIIAGMHGWSALSPGTRTAFMNMVRLAAHTQGLNDHVSNTAVRAGWQPILKQVLDTDSRNSAPRAH